MASRLVLNSWAHWNLLPPPLEQHVFQWHLAMPEALGSVLNTGGEGLIGVCKVLSK